MNEQSPAPRPARPERSTRPERPARLSRRATVLAATAASALLAGATRTTWIHAAAPDLTGTVQQVEVMGSEAAPAVLALSLAAIAASLATSLSSAWLRFLTGPVLIVTGAGAALAAFSAAQSPQDAVGSAVASATGVLGAAVQVEATAWPLLTLIPALAVAVFGVLVLAVGRSWPTGGRYRSAALAAPVRRSDPAEDPAAAWDALTRGEDPSLGSREPGDAGDPDSEEDEPEPPVPERPTTAG